MWGFLENSLKTLPSATAWNRGSTQNMAESTKDRTGEETSPSIIGGCKRHFTESTAGRESLLPGSHVPQVGQLQVGNRTSVSLPIPST